MKYKILKLLKTTNKIVFETNDLKELKDKAVNLGLKAFNKPYIFTSIRCEDVNGKQYAITNCVMFDTGQSIACSPSDEMLKLFNL